MKTTPCNLPCMRIVKHHEHKDMEPTSIRATVRNALKEYTRIFTLYELKQFFIQLSSSSVQNSGSQIPLNRTYNSADSHTGVLTDCVGWLEVGDVATWRVVVVADSTSGWISIKFGRVHGFKLIGFTCISNRPGSL